MQHCRLVAWVQRCWHVGWMQGCRRVSRVQGYRQVGRVQRCWQVGWMQGYRRVSRVQRCRQVTWVQGCRSIRGGLRLPAHGSIWHGRARRMVLLLVGRLPLTSAGLTSAGLTSHRDAEAPAVLRLAGGTCRNRRLTAIRQGRRLAAIGRRRLAAIGRRRLAAVRQGSRLAAIGRRRLAAVRRGRWPAAVRRRWRCRGRVRASAKFVAVKEGGKLLGLLGVDSEYDAWLAPRLL